MDSVLGSEGGGWGGGAEEIGSTDAGKSLIDRITPHGRSVLSQDLPRVLHFWNLQQRRPWLKLFRNDRKPGHRSPARLPALASAPFPHASLSEPPAAQQLVVDSSRLPS